MENAGAQRYEKQGNGYTKQGGPRWPLAATVREERGSAISISTENTGAARNPSKWNTHSGNTSALST